MIPNKTKKIVAGFLIFSQLAFWPAVIFAQMAVPTSDSNNGNSVGGVAGMAANTAEKAALTAAYTAYQTGCLTTVHLADTAFAKANVGNSTAAVLSPTGNGQLLAAMEVLDTAYDVFLTCAGVAQTSFSSGAGSLAASSLYTGNTKEQYLNNITADIATYEKKQDNLEAKIDNANQGFWKTLLISVLLQTSKSIADALVTKLVQNYKITNLKQYIDSAATLMYDNQFIRDNFPDAQGQLMARAIISNPLFRTQIQPSIFVAANAALGYNPAAMNPASPNFYGQMAAMGSPAANPYYLQTAYVGGVDQSHAAAMATAQQQISQGSGYKAPVNCAGSLTQQKQIDAQNQAAENQLANRQALLNSLISTRNTMTNFTTAQAQQIDSDIAKAQADVDAATKVLNNLPSTVTGASSNTSSSSLSANLTSGTNTEGTMAIVMCEAISSPAVLVNQGIDAMFKAVGGNLSQYNSSNLPAFVNIISGIASQIGTSMVLGGTSAAAHSALMNENQAINATVAAGAATAAQKLQPQVSVSGGLKTQYYMGDQIPFLSSNLPTDGTVTFLVNGQNYDNVAANQMSGYAIKIDNNFTAGSNTLVAQIYDTNENLVSTITLGAVNVASGPSTLSTTLQSFDHPSQEPAVAGAFTGKPVFQTRGPVAQLSIRQ
jgi:hypothetical protein